MNSQFIQVPLPIMFTILIAVWANSKACFWPTLGTGNPKTEDA
jgi:hypothetical protein